MKPLKRSGKLPLMDIRPDCGPWMQRHTRTWNCSLVLRTPGNLFILSFSKKPFVGIWLLKSFFQAFCTQLQGTPMALWRRCQTKPGTGCMIASWKWIMRCLVTSNSLWQAVPSKPRLEHTCPSSHHYTSVWWPTFWVLWNAAQKEIAMSSRQYPDVMLCESMNLPPLLWNPEWPLWRNTKKTTEFRNAVNRMVFSVLTAQFWGVHSKTAGSLNAAGRIQDLKHVVCGWLEFVGRILPCLHSIYPRPATEITTKRCKSKRLAFGRIGLHQFPFGWTMLCWCNKLKYTKKELWGTLNLIARLSKPRFCLSGQLLSSHSEIKKHWHFCWQFGTCIGPKTKRPGSFNFGRFSFTASGNSGRFRLWKFQHKKKTCKKSVGCWRWSKIRVFCWSSDRKMQGA